MNIAIIGATGAIGKALLSYYLTLDTTNKIHAFSRKQSQHSDPRVISGSLDLLDPNSIREAAETIEPHSMDLIITATGILHSSEELPLRPEKSMKLLDAACMEKVFAINTIGPALVLKYFLPLLKQDGKPIFAALSARVGSISDNHLGGWYSYRASKAALNMLIKTAAIEYARVNKQGVIIGVHPGTVDSALSKPFQTRVPEKQLFSPDQAAIHLAHILESLDQSNSGKCFAWDGKEIPA